MQIDKLKSIVRACEIKAHDNQVRIEHIASTINGGYMVDLAEEIETFAKLVRLKAKERISEIENQVAAL